MEYTKKVKYVICGILMGIMLTSVVSFAYESYIKQIEVSTGVKIYINNDALIPVDVNGNEVDVFLYGGTTYLPVRSIATAFDKEIYWDNDSRSVYINDATEESSIEIVDKSFPDSHYSEREEEISFVMLHFSSDVVANPDNPFNVDNVLDIFRDYYSSVHYVIDRDGIIYQCVDESYSAWHAGSGTWDNDSQYTNRMNQYSIGIELLAIGTEDEMSLYLDSAAYAAIDDENIGYTDAQYSSLNLLLSDITARNTSITYDAQHIIGHDEYSSNKNDPGSLFDWSKIGIDK